METGQNYLETTEATKWCNDVSALLEEIDKNLKNAAQLLKDIGDENVGTLGKDLQDQGDAFIGAFTEMAHGFAGCVAVLVKHIESVVKTVVDDENLLKFAQATIGIVKAFVGAG